jgi:hypothetical protein
MISLSAQRPHFLPDFHFFYRIFASDIFLLADHLRFRKQSPMVRTKITSNIPPHYLTVPIRHDQTYPHPQLKEIKLFSDKFWRERHLKTLKSICQKSPYFEEYFESLQSIYNRQHQYLLDFLLDLIKWQTDLLFTEKKIILSSEAKINDLEDLKGWIRHFEWPTLLYYEDEINYYQTNFAEFRKEPIFFSEKQLIKIPSEYQPEQTFLILLFLKGPESILYFE